MADAMTASAQYVLKQSLEELRAAVDGVSAEALNWKPGGEDTNSIAVLATHVMHSTRSWLSIAVGAPLPERDRDEEFRASEYDPGALLRLVDAMSEDCRRLLAEVGEVDWAATRKTHARPGNAPEEVAAAFALLHALEHLGQHVAHCSLTRQVWEARGA
ncbi:MAG: DinB family protein [Dehalococcoidia bacterium]